MSFELSRFVHDFATAIEAIDARRPVAESKRVKGTMYQPGIGPHSEAETVSMVIDWLRREHPNVYNGCEREVPYPSGSRQKCDLCFRAAADWEWSIEIKMLRVMGDNGKPNDNILMHILSPYSADRSAVTDCDKLLNSGLDGRKAIVIFAFEYDRYPAEPVIRAFELLARDRVIVGPRNVAAFDDLVHPVHKRGRVYAWEISARPESGESSG
jgi:hypothetical protein